MKLSCNFCHRHGTIKITPAVAVVAAGERWTVAELLGRLLERIDQLYPPKPE